jgi:hypothetical protein
MKTVFLHFIHQKIMTISSFFQRSLKKKLRTHRKLMFSHRKTTNVKQANSGCLTLHGEAMRFKG